MVVYGRWGVATVLRCCTFFRMLLRVRFCLQYTFTFYHFRNDKSIIELTGTARSCVFTSRSPSWHLLDASSDKYLTVQMTRPQPIWDSTTFFSRFVSLVCDWRLVTSTRRDCVWLKNGKPGCALNASTTTSLRIAITTTITVSATAKSLNHRTLQPKTIHNG